MTVCTSLYPMTVCTSLYPMTVCTSLYPMTVCTSLYPMTVCTSLYPMTVCTGPYPMTVCTGRSLTGAMCSGSKSPPSPAGLTLCAIQYSDVEVLRTTELAITDIRQQLQKYELLSLQFVIRKNNQIDIHPCRRTAERDTLVAVQEPVIPAIGGRGVAVVHDFEADSGVEL